MPVLVCPRCRRTNPEVAEFCYFDGADLRSHEGGVGNRLRQEFVFPSGRRCRTFDDLAQGCQDDWAGARDLLHKGVFGQFFSASGRLDLVKVTQEAKNQPDPDIALVRFINALPVSKAEAPRLDLNPRRFLLGNLTAGDSRKLQVMISNQGQGILQGTLKVSEGGQWLHLAGSANGECSLRIAKDQNFALNVDTKGMPAAQTYGGKLTVITNGGVVEVPVRMDLVAQPFPRPPFHGAKTPREMAERMRAQPKAAVPLLESGEIARWFASNGWNYPVRGTPARGVAGIQQFFEAMGLSKPPAVMVAQPEVRFSCVYPESQRFQVALHTSAKKWVYASVESDSPWLKVLTPHVAGPQHAAIAFEVDSRFLPGGRCEGRLKIQANAGQNLAIRVGGEARGAPAVRKGGLVNAMVAMALACLLLRLLLIPVADVLAPGPATRSAAQSVDHPTGAGSTLHAVGGWLTLPWPKILLGTGKVDAKVFDSVDTASVKSSEFRHYYLGAFVRRFVWLTWWVWALVGMLVLWRRGGVGDLLFGLIAGAALGMAVSATLACAVLVVEIVPHSILQPEQAGLGVLIVWIFLALVSWTLFGILLGLVFGLAGPLRRLIVEPVQKVLGGIFRICGLKGLGRTVAAG